MKKKMLAVVFFLIFLFSGDAYAEVKICEIIYGKKEEIPLKIPNVLRLLNNLPDCYQIGTEYNEHGEEMKNKPIFTCCRSEG